MFKVDILFACLDTKTIRVTQLTQKIKTHSTSIPLAGRVFDVTSAGDDDKSEVVQQVNSGLPQV